MSSLSWRFLPWPARISLAWIGLSFLGFSNAELPAQNRAPRHLVIGQIEDEEGTWKAAEVLFFSQARLEGIEPLDEARGRTGSKRGILARLQAGRAYRAVARLDREGQPSLWTRIEKVPVGATSFTLKPRLFAPDRPKIRILGEEAWKKVSPLEFRLVDALGRSRPLEASLDEDRRLPSLPGPICWIEVREQTGRRLYIFGIRLKRKDAPETRELHLPPPLRVRLHVQDAKTGDPIAGARVFDDLSRNEDIGDQGFRTNDKGELQLWMAHPMSPKGGLDESYPLLFRIFAEGHPLTCAGWNSKQLGADQRPPPRGKDGSLTLEIRMKTCSTLKGSFLHFPGRVLAKLRFFVRMQTMMPGPQDVRTWTGLPWFEVKVQQDGSYRLPRLSQDQGHLQRLLFFPDDLMTQWTELQAEGRALGRSERLLPLPAIKLEKSHQDLHLPPVDGRLLRFLDFHVRLADGDRGKDLPIHILFPNTETSIPKKRLLLGSFDGRGRFRRIYYGVVPALYVRSAKSYALIEGDKLDSMGRKDPGKATVIQLEALPTIRGKVLMADGSPAPQARVRLKPLRLVRTDRSEDKEFRFMVALLLIALHSETHIQKDGTFEIAYLPFPERSLLLDASFRNKQGKFYHAAQPLDLGHSEPVTLTFQR